MVVQGRVREVNLPHPMIGCVMFRVATHSIVAVYVDHSSGDQP
jgi:hypothetical protein